MEDSPRPIPIFLLPPRQLIPARSCTAQHRIGMTNGTGTPHSSLAVKTAGFALAVQQILSNGWNSTVSVAPTLPSSD